MVQYGVGVAVEPWWSACMISEDAFPHGARCSFRAAKNEPLRIDCIKRNSLLMFGRADKTLCMLPPVPSHANVGREIV